MIRFVIGPGRVVVPDLAARLPGRGIWLSARADVLETARVRGHFARAARGAVSAPPDLTTIVATGLERRVEELLGFARRAGQAMAGFEKAREWLRAGKAALILQASDGSEAERLRFLSGAVAPAAAPLTAAALGRIFGREHVVHVALAPGRLAEAIKHEAERLSGFTGQTQAKAAAQAGARTKRNDTQRMDGQTSQ